MSYPNRIYSLKYYIVCQFVLICIMAQKCANHIKCDPLMHISLTTKNPFVVTHTHTQTVCDRRGRLAAYKNRARDHRLVGEAPPPYDVAAIYCHLCAGSGSSYTSYRALVWGFTLCNQPMCGFTRLAFS